MGDKQVLLRVEDLKKYFISRGRGWGFKRRVLKALDGVTLTINKGETLGLVGESGCGKTTLGRTVLRLYNATGGKIVFDGNDITGLTDSQMFPYRKRMQIVFQDPYASLDTRMTVFDILSEPLEVHKISNGDRKDIVNQLLREVGLSPKHANRYPHEFSGGERQRVGIARALAVQPEFIVCDEPISALDVSIQAQIINLLMELQDELKLTYLFIAHDLTMIRYISDRIGVMYLGKLVELADRDQLYKNPLHPYTKALFASILVPDPGMAGNNKRTVLKGDVPSPLNTPSGCRFRTRCRYAVALCEEKEPVLKKVDNRHFVACHLVS
ncbi:MAG TPA: oligopeptide/dipeptide ABC transporter ATP-binding protein [Clostridia bacterium]|nr:oligopeptide/dipeptide ABC transporter ATP-binding protein [Clostridia bacterium]